MISHSLLYVSVHDLLFVPAPAILAGRALPLQDAVMGNTATDSDGRGDVPCDIARHICAPAPVPYGLLQLP